MEEAGSKPKKGFEVKLGGFGVRSRSHRTAVHGESAVSAAAVDALKQSFWANIPLELLRDVLTRVDDSEGAWPLRKNVVACAGVCRNWRNITRDIVKTPEESGKLTFPISLKQPGPRDLLLQCFIRRNRTTHTYHLYLGLTQALADTGKFLLAARRSRRPTRTEYIVSMNTNDMSKGSSAYIGKLRSNFIGTKFVVYDAMPPHNGAVLAKNCSSRLGSKQVSPKVPAGNYPVAHIAYELNVLGSRGPRRMQCVMDTIPTTAMGAGGTAPTQRDPPLSGDEMFPSIPFGRTKCSRLGSSLSASCSGSKDMLILKNKSPRWHEQLQCWCLNFQGRVTVASVKNFQLVASADNGQSPEEHDKVLLQFGKVGKDLFTMDYGYPLSAFQAFAICLSSFDTNIACE